MNQGRVFGYRRTLDLEKATLTRSLIWQNNKGAVVQITFERFASLDMEHLIAQRVSVRALGDPCTIMVTASIDGTQTSEGINHWGSISAGAAQNGYIGVVGQTGQSQYGVAVAAALISDREITGEVNSRGLTPSISMSCKLEHDELVTFVKLSAIHSTRDSTNPLKAAYETLDTA